MWSCAFVFVTKLVCPDEIGMCFVPTLACMCVRVCVCVLCVCLPVQLFAALHDRALPRQMHSALVVDVFGLFEDRCLMMRLACGL